MEVLSHKSPHSPATVLNLRRYFLPVSVCCNSRKPARPNRDMIFLEMAA